MNAMVKIPPSPVPPYSSSVQEKGERDRKNCISEGNQILSYQFSKAQL